MPRSLRLQYIKRKKNHLSTRVIYKKSGRLGNLARREKRREQQENEEPPPSADTEWNMEDYPNMVVETLESEPETDILSSDVTSALPPEPPTEEPQLPGVSSSPKREALPADEPTEQPQAPEGSGRPKRRVRSPTRFAPILKPKKRPPTSKVPKRVRRPQPVPTYRIVHVKHLIDQIQQSNYQHTKRCDFSNMAYLKEVFDDPQCPLHSSLILECSKCKVQLGFSLFPEDYDFHIALVRSVIEAGVGYDAAEKILSGLGLPFLSPIHFTWHALNQGLTPAQPIHPVTMDASTQTLPLEKPELPPSRTKPPNAKCANGVSTATTSGTQTPKDHFRSPFPSPHPIKLRKYPSNPSATPTYSDFGFTTDDSLGPSIAPDPSSATDESPASRRPTPRSQRPVRGRNKRPDLSSATPPDFRFATDDSPGSSTAPDTSFATDDSPASRRTTPQSQRQRQNKRPGLPPSKCAVSISALLREHPLSKPTPVIPGFQVKFVRKRFKLKSGYSGLARCDFIHESYHPNFSSIEAPISMDDYPVSIDTPPSPSPSLDVDEQLASSMSGEVSKAIKLEVADVEDDFDLFSKNEVGWSFCRSEYELHGEAESSSRPIEGNTLHAEASPGVENPHSSSNRASCAPSTGIKLKPDLDTPDLQFQRGKTGRSYANKNKDRAHKLENDILTRPPDVRSPYESTFIGSAIASTSETYSNLRSPCESTFLRHNHPELSATPSTSEIDSNVQSPFESLLIGHDHPDLCPSPSTSETYSNVESPYDSLFPGNDHFDLSATPSTREIYTNVRSPSGHDQPYLSDTSTTPSTSEIYSSTVNIKCEEDWDDFGSVTVKQEVDFGLEETEGEIEADVTENCPDAVYSESLDMRSDARLRHIIQLEHDYISSWPTANFDASNGISSANQHRSTNSQILYRPVRRKPTISKDYGYA